MIIVALWQDAGFGGCKRTFGSQGFGTVRVDDPRVGFGWGVPDLSLFNFNDKTSAIGIHPGPGPLPQPAVVSFFEHAGYGGRRLVVDGQVANLANAGYSFNDVISSILIHDNPTSPDDSTPPRLGLYQAGADTPEPAFESLAPSAQIETTPLIVSLYIDAFARTSGYDRQLSPGEEPDGKKHIVLFESCDNLGNVYGQEFNDSISGVVIKQGPGFTGREIVRLHRDAGFMGGAVELKLGETYDDLTNLNFNDVASSVEVAVC